MSVATIGQMPAVVNLPNGPYVEGSTPIYTGQLLDNYGVGIPAASLLDLTLTILDTLSGAVINGCFEVDILNSDRGVVDASGNMTVTLQTGDTSLDDVPSAAQIQRSLIFSWTTTSNLVGGHEARFFVQRLTEADNSTVPSPFLPLRGEIATVNKTANYSISVNDNGIHFNNFGALSPVILTLPEAAPGLNYGFLVSSAPAGGGITVVATSGDTIAIGADVSAAGGSAQCDTLDGYLVLVCHQVANWVAVGSPTGIWTIS